MRPVDRYDVPLLMAGSTETRFHIMIKPSGASCNLDCTYCFYLDKEFLGGGIGKGRMNEETLEVLIRKYIEAVTGPEVVFSWQGGEPTLMGLPFFMKIVELQRKYAKEGQKILNDLQTNGTLLDDKWCGFLREHDFLVGLSIDGPKEFHDAFRVNKGGAGTFDKVFAASKMLKRHGVPFNTLTCVNRTNAKHPLEVYRFLRDQVGSTCIQFIPIVEPVGFETAAPDDWLAKPIPKVDEPAARPGVEGSVVTDWSVDPVDWGDFLIAVFDEWAGKDCGRILVNHFESLVSQRFGLGSQICVYGEVCGKGLAVEHDGSVYSCDHYVYPKHRVGSVHQGPLRSTVLSRKQVRFGYAKNERLPSQCRTCRHLTDCWGECPKNRLVRDVNGEPGLNYLCRGFYAYFEHAGPVIDKMVARLESGTPRESLAEAIR